MEALGIEFETLDYGAIMRFPLELSDLQLKRITSTYESDGWKIEQIGDRLVMRKGASKVELGRQRAIVVADEANLMDIKNSIESIYRRTLDRALVFQLVASESASSALLNTFRRKFRSSVTDCYYACFNALRAGLALTTDEAQAERLEHPGLKTPEARPEECEWNLSKRARWVRGVEAVIDALGKPENKSKVAEVARNALNVLVEWSKRNISYEVRGEEGDVYADAVSSVSPESVALERFLAERTYWLRIRADYRVDFEATISSSTISEVLYGALAFTNAVTALVRKQLAFPRTILERDEGFRRTFIRGQVIDLGYDSGKVARALLLSDSVAWTADEDQPGRTFHGRLLAPFLSRSIQMKFPAIREAGTDPLTIDTQKSLAEETYALRNLIVHFSDRLSFGEGETQGPVTAVFGKERTFSLTAERDEFAHGVIPAALEDLVQAIRGTHPNAYVVLQGNRRTLHDVRYMAHRIEDYEA